MNAVPPPGSIEEQAARWFLRLREPDVQPEEIDAALAWKDENEQHHDAFARVEAAWWAADGLPPGAALPPAHRISRVSSRFWHGWGWGIAAALVVGVVGANYAEIGKLGVHFGRLQPSNMPAPANTAQNGVPDHALATTITTARGENRTLDLSDGSKVELGAASSISIDFTPTVRRVTLLTGEALFHVYKDPAHPFVVDAGGGETQAIGTVFDVHRQLEDVTVSVVEGVVQVQSGLPSSASAKLAAGHEVTYSVSGKIGAVKKAAVPSTTSWREGELTFVDRNLSDVVADLNRYSKRPILLADDDLKSLRITGVVQVEQMQEWLHALEKNLPVRIYATADRITLLDRSPDKQDK